MRDTVAQIAAEFLETYDDLTDAEREHLTECVEKRSDFVLFRGAITSDDNIRYERSARKHLFDAMDEIRALTTEFGADNDVWRMSTQKQLDWVRDQLTELRDLRAARGERG